MPSYNQSANIIGEPPTPAEPTGSSARPNRKSDLHQFTRAVADRIEHISLSELKPPRRRTRTHHNSQIELIKGSFHAFGILNPLLVDENSEILAGYARWKAAGELGITTLPVIRVAHLSPAEKRAYAIADNRIAERAGWDTKALKLEFEFLASVDLDFDLDTLGFSVAEIDLLIDGTEAVADDADALPAARANSTSKPGDLWLLGSHQLLCGSALAQESYEVLLGGDKARMLLTDPPYNVPVDGFIGGLGKVKHREFAMASGEMTEAEFTEFLSSFLNYAASKLIDGGLGYVFMDWRHSYVLQTAARAQKLKLHNLCVWDKENGGMGSHYRSQHELCHIFKSGSAPHLNTVQLGKYGRYRTNVWAYRGLTSFGAGRDAALQSHPTVKPVAMLVDAIKDCTRRSDIVLDPFAGSGSTLIAAERTGRVCRAIELDPCYCDTIVRRYQELTGKQATHASSGSPFNAFGTRDAPVDGEARDA